MEETGNLRLSLVLKSTVNKHHIRRVMLFKAWGTKRQAAKEMHEFLEANSEVAHLNVELVWKVQEEHLPLEALHQLRK